MEEEEEEEEVEQRIEHAVAHKGNCHPRTLTLDSGYVRYVHILPYGIEEYLHSILMIHDTLYMIQRCARPKRDADAQMMQMKMQQDEILEWRSLG